MRCDRKTSESIVLNIGLLSVTNAIVIVRISIGIGVSVVIVIIIDHVLFVSIAL